MKKRVLGWFLLCIGFLLPFCALAEEKVVIDVEKGIWEYETQGLHIIINRKEDDKIPLIWYETELFCSEENPLLAITQNPLRKTSRFHAPDVLARANKLVFAINDDYFLDRVYNKERPGIIIRNGKLLEYETYKSGNKRFPNLDTLAILPNGNIKVFESQEMTPTQYFEMGAQDVFAFGPILVRGGEVNERLQTEHMETEPRVAFGIVEPFHYVCIVTEGRYELSKGVSCFDLAKMIRGMGAVEALNMDGGQTAALVFMGEKINRTGIYNNRSRIRNISSMLGAGISDLVPD